MSQQLKKTQQFQVEDTREALEMIDNFLKNAPSEGYEVSKAGFSIKRKKQKGEIIAEWAVVTIEIKYSEEI